MLSNYGQNYCFKPTRLNGQIYQQRRKGAQQDSTQKTKMKNVRALLSTLFAASIIDVVVSFSFVSPLNKPSMPRLAGGPQAEHGKFPWIISIQYREGNAWRHDCGGAIMDPTHIVTAGHCVWDRNTSEMEVVAGAHNIKIHEFTQQRRKPDKIYLHPNYTSGNGPGAYDIAILRTEQPFNFGKYVGRIDMAKCNQGAKKGDECMFAGWGNLFPISPLYFKGSDFLVAEPTTVISMKECKQAYPLYPDALKTALCSKSGMLHGTCQGDSGGPLTCYKDKNSPVPYLAGVVSFGFPVCNDGYHPDVYTNVGNPQICTFLTKFEEISQRNVVWTR